MPKKICTSLFVGTKQIHSFACRFLNFNVLYVVYGSCKFSETIYPVLVITYQMHYILIADDVQLQYGHVLCRDFQI